MSGWVSKRLLRAPRGGARVAEAESFERLAFMNAMACSFYATRTPRKVKKILKARWEAKCGEVAR